MKPKVNLYDLSFRKLAPADVAPDFVCEKQTINNWFAGAAQAQHANLYCRVTTVHDGDDSSVVGFYAMSIQFEHQSLFSSYSFIRDLVFTDKRVPTAHLHWIAVRSDDCGYGIGRLMIGKIIDDAFQLIDKGGLYALTLKYIDEKSRNIYSRRKFVPYGDEGQKMMYLPAQTIVDTVSQS